MDLFSRQQHSDTSMNFNNLRTKIHALYFPLLAIGLAVACCVTLTAVNAQEAPQAGVLDTLPSNPAKGSATTLTDTAVEVAEEFEQIKKALISERRDLKAMPRQKLLELANEGQRAAQLILAEDFADEALRESLTVVSANAALSDAASWYSQAASRGFPGAIQVDGALPVFPLRSVRARGDN